MDSYIYGREAGENERVYEEKVVHALRMELEAERKDASRYRALKATRKYCVDRYGGWGLATGNGTWSDQELDAAADKLLESHNACGQVRSEAASPAPRS